MEEIETQKYTITGLVDFSDEQGNIVGQFEIGSVQELPVSVGEAAVADGRAEVFEGEEEVEEEAAGDAPTGESGEAPVFVGDRAPAPESDDESGDEDEDDDEDDDLGEDDTTA